MVTTKPTLDEEIKLFKAVVRHIFKHEVKHGKGKCFRMDNRSNLRRLSDLGVSGHQPALMIFCQMTKKEKESIIEAIRKQKVANNRKAEAQYTEHRERTTEKEAVDQAAGTQSDWDDTILLRIARIAYGSAVKWRKGTKN